jgi:hypothetical protein
VFTREQLEMLACLLMPALTERTKRSRRQNLPSTPRIEPNPKGVQRLADWLDRNLEDQDASADPLELLAALLEHLRKSEADELAYLVGNSNEEARAGAGKQSRLMLLPNSYILVSSAALYHLLEDRLSSREFAQVPWSPYPTAILTTSDFEGLAQLKPRIIDTAPVTAEENEKLISLMWKYVEQMSDFDCDVLDILISEWIRRAKGPQDFVVLRINRMLDMRGINQRKDPQGGRSGYRKSQKARVLASIERLASLWLLFQLKSFEKKSSKRPVCGPIDAPAFYLNGCGQYNLEGNLEVGGVSFRPCELLSLFLQGSGKQIALLSTKALTYSTLGEKHEKRLARYLSWRWRIGAHDTSYFRPYRVETLIKAIRLRVDERFPSRTLDRLEKILERLQRDVIIAGFQYRNWNSPSGYNWLDDWLQTTILIEPPDIIVNTYQNIGKKPPARTDLAERLQAKRASDHLSRLRAAEEAGVQAEELLQAELGTAPRHIQERVERWLKSTGS